jgi:hypothetical protein
VANDYFGPSMVNRQRLVWSTATRRQLERWEPLVAAYVRDLHAGRETDSAAVWSAEIEHHFLLIAARNLFRALDELNPRSSVPVEQALRAEVIEGRDLHEHWRENLPVFMVDPRDAQPKHRSGKAFAARNPDQGPYWWLGFTWKTGALVMPHVSACALHELLDAVEAEIHASDELGVLRRFVPPRAASPWIYQNGEWWPKPNLGGAAPSK